MFALLLAGAFVEHSVSAQNARDLNSSTTVDVDPGRSWGKWEGWGTSLCWWAKIFGDRDDIADLLFTTGTVDFEGQKLSGLGLNIVRYNAGACSWNPIDGRQMVVSKTILPFRQMEGFWLDGKNTDPTSKSWDWSVDANQRAMLLKARDRGANQFELFSNSPMWWMCGNLNPSGNASKTEDNLKPENYRAFAVYLATIARQAKEKWGIAFTTVEPFNEPISGWWVENGKQEGCYFSSASQRNFLPVLRLELDRRGLKEMPIAASDETNYGQALSTWNSFDATTKSLIQQVNVHGYQGIRGPRSELYQAVVEHDGKPLRNSEYGDKFADGLELARCLLLDLKKLHPTAWCYWQPLDGGNSSGWGLIQADLSKKTIGQANPKYFVLAQFTRHIRPGMTILECSESNAVAAYDSAAHRLAMIVFNEGPARKITCDFSKFTVPDGAVASWITEPNGTAHYREENDIHLAAKKFDATLPACSLRTFVLENVMIPLP